MLNNLATVLRKQRTKRERVATITSRVPYRRKIGHIGTVDYMEAHGKAKENGDERHEEKKNVRQRPEDGQGDYIQT